MDATLNSISSREHRGAETGDGGGKDCHLQLVLAVDQAVRLLFSLANTVGGEASLTQLTKEVGISKTKGLAILNMLRSAGLTVRDERSKNYALGPKLLLLSRALINNTDLARAAAPDLEELGRPLRTGPCGQALADRPLPAVVGAPPARGRRAR